MTIMYGTDLYSTLFTKVRIFSLEKFAFHELVKRVLQSGVLDGHIQRKERFFLFVSVAWKFKFMKEIIQYNYISLSHDGALGKAAQSGFAKAK